MSHHPDDWPRTRPSLPQRTLLGLLVLVCSGFLPVGSCQAAEKRAPDVSLFMLGQVHGYKEPCGCTSDPLGDMARLAALVRGARSPALLLDAGGLRYDATPPAAERRPQARRTADFLEGLYQRLGAIVGLLPEDLHGGDLPPSRRVCANLTGRPVLPHVLRQVGPLRVGVFGLASPEAPWPAGVQVSDPAAAARAQVALLRQQGAQLVVALAGLPRPAARRLMQAAPGIDVLVVGAELDDKGAEDPEPVGGGLLIVPAYQGQRVARLDLFLDQGRPVMSWRRGPGWQKREAERLRREEARQRELYERLRADPAAEPAFVRRIEKELAGLRRALADLQRPQPAPRGGYVTMELVPIRRSLPRDPQVAREMDALDRRIAEENLAAVTEPPPPPPRGQPAYVGNAGCLGKCHYHEEAFPFWQKMVHARAWSTLVRAGKELSYDCVGCHSIGFGQPGGSNLRSLAFPGQPIKGRIVPDLRDVGCEACHGPGSLHVASPAKVPVPTPKPGKELCLGCHPKEHSDTFDHVPYLRDILGPGHGEEERKKLGEGTTGAQLRKAALEKHKP
jgi:hypothetical protein